MITNADIIRMMSNERLAEFLYVLLEQIKRPYNKDKIMDYLVEWLNEEYYEERTDWTGFKSIVYYD